MAELDLVVHGVPGAICCHRVDGVLVDPGPAVSVHTLRERLGGFQPDAILLTHIHLDHAGATGVLVREWPDLEVYVHELGAPHVIDPSKLIASATRIYGADAMERLWGEIAPVPERNVHVLAGDGGDFHGWRWLYTPGHAVHHVAYFHDDVAYVGDVGGVRVGRGPVLAPTPPPDIDVEVWHDSINKVQAQQPRALALTHFGLFDDVAWHLGELRQALDRWTQRAEVQDADAFERSVRAEIAGLEEESSYLTGMPPETMYAGLARYWRKRHNEPR